MNFPPFWARGVRGDFSCWRWSAKSLAEAQALADQAAEQLAERFTHGDIPARTRGYYPDRPFREQVLRELKNPAGELVAVVTRNSYGCLVLNTSHVMFIDVDLPEPKRSGGLFSRLFGKSDPVSAGNPADTVLAKAETWSRNNPGWGWRIYRTRAGLRLLATHALFEPDVAATDSVFGAALGRFPPDIEFALLLARDGCEEMVPLQKRAMNVASVLQPAGLHHAGGHDNVPALVRAWEVASAAKAGAILWVHGPQPVLFDSVDGLRQRLERGGSSPVLLEIQTEPGPNRVLEKLDGLKPVRSILRLGDLGDDLGRVFAAWSTRAIVLTMARERVESGSVGDQAQATETSMHLARLWAAEEVSRLAEARQFAEATRLAARYQLVTPFSGAVVLETQDQYASAGLQPVPPESVPTVPEPSSAILWLIGFALLVPVLRRRREHDT